MEEPLCKLCKRNIANQTGSHIFSWFLIRDAINKLGIQRRNNEITFEISTDKFVKTYFGSEILPDEIQKVKGNDLSDEEISQMTNPFTRDYILCSNCEKRLSRLEEICSNKYFQKLRNYKVENNNYDTLQLEDGGILRLFVYSLAWRGAIVQQNDFNMDSSHEEKLRKILDLNLSTNEAELYKNIEVNKNEINSLPLILTFSETIGDNTNFIFCSWSRRPYSMMLNDFSFQLFFNKKHTKKINEHFFAINQIISTKKLLNLDENEIKVAVFPNEKRVFINRKVAGYVANKMLKRATDIFKEGFEMFFHRPCPKGIARYFRARVALSRTDQIEKFTPEHFIEVASHVLHEYANMNHFVLGNPLFY